MFIFNLAQKFLILFCFANSCLSFSAFGKEENRIYVTGNKRTSSSYIEKLTQKCLQNTYAKEDASHLQEVKQCLFNSKLFSQLTVERQQDNSLHVNVEERWTLIPLPFASLAGNNNFTAGIFLFESNFLGLGKIFALGGIYSSKGSSFFGLYKDNSVFLTNWRFALSANESQQEVLLSGKSDSSTDNSIDGFYERKASGGMSLGYQITHDLNLDVDYQHSEIKTETLHNYKLDPGDVNTETLGLQSEFQALDYKIYYQDGLNLKGKVNTQVYRTDKVSPAVQGTIRTQYGQSLFQNQALLMLLQAGTMSGGNVGDLFRVGGNAGFRGIGSKGAWVESYASFATDYLIPIKFFDSGTWAAPVFGEAGLLNIYKNEQKEKLNYESYGVGTYYFLSKIAIPGLGLEIGHNTAFQNLFISASIGLSVN